MILFYFQFIASKIASFFYNHTYALLIHMDAVRMDDDLVMMHQHSENNNNNNNKICNKNENHCHNHDTNFLIDHHSNTLSSLFNRHYAIAFILFIIILTEGTIGLQYEHSIFEHNKNINNIKDSNISITIIFQNFSQSRYIMFHQMLPPILWLYTDMIMVANCLASILVYGIMMFKSNIPDRFKLYCHNYHSNYIQLEHQCQNNCVIQVDNRGKLGELTFLFTNLISFFFLPNLNLQKPILLKY